MLGPLSIPAHTDPVLAQALLAIRACARSRTRLAWANAYAKAIARGAGIGHNLTPGDYGPMPTMMAAYLQMAQSGGLDAALTSTGRFYQSNFTKALLFLADGSYLEAWPRSRTCSGASGG